MNVERSHLCLLGGLIVALSLVQPALGMSASGVIEGFSLNSCGAKNCISIEAPKAYVGAFAGSYGFSKAKFVIFPVQKQGVKRNIKRTEFNSNDLYYDFFSKKIFIRAIIERPGHEAYYDLETEEVRSFPTM
jgi:hypothetical protein